MIEFLTTKQTARLAEFRDKWMTIGLSTQPANRPMAERGIRAAYRLAGLKPPRIVWCLSPLTSGLTRDLVLGKTKASVGASVRASVRDSVWASVGASVRASVRDSVWDNVGDSVGASVRASVWASVRASVRASVWTSIWDSVRASIWDSVWASVRASVRDSIRDSVGDSIGDSGYGNHDAAWLGFYDYFARVVGLKHLTTKLSGLWCIAQSAGWFLPHEHICWVSERPCELHLAPNDRGIKVLHRDGGPSWKYPDGFCGWNLHGVRVPQAVAETMAAKMDVAWLHENFVKQQNAEIRREIIRKVGIEVVINRLGAVEIQRWQGSCPWENYTLLQFEVQPGQLCRYLKMPNPSISTPDNPVYHIERVGNECNTIEEARRWREPNELREKPRSENGRPYQQQGDVYVWPGDAEVLQPWPEVVT